MGIATTHTERRRRRATTTVESAVVLAVCLVLLFGMLDLSLLVMRNTLMSAAARRVARAAMVHGGSASASQGQWGPASLTTHGASDDPAALAIRDMLLTLDPNEVSINLVWLDGGNKPDQRVQVIVRYTHHAT